MAAEALIGAPVISAVINPLIPIAYEKMQHVWGVRTEMKKLYQFLKKIQAVLIDAEKQQEQREPVKIWLEELKDVAYDAEDVLDEFQYESLQRETENQGRKRDKLKNLSPLDKLAFRLKMSHKIRNLNRRMEGIARGTALLGFNVSSSTPTTNSNGLRNRETFSHEDTSGIVGREAEKTKIINLLVNNTSNDEVTCSIICIFGMGGVGKTVLAQSIFADQSVTHHFDKNKLWIYVPQNSDQKEIFGKILERMEEKNYDFSSLELILSKIKESAQGKRYLIVLDDIWNADNNDWDDMLKPLLCIFSKETKVIVTTRGVEAVSRLSTSSYTHRLDIVWNRFGLSVY